MATQNKPVIHTFKEVNVGKFGSVKHFELIEVSNGNSFLSNLINISKDRGFSKAKPAFWLKVRVGNKWGKPEFTGLFKTNRKNIYRGDIDNRTHLVLFKFSDDKSTLIIAIYRYYFTTDLSHLLPIFDK